MQTPTFGHTIQDLLDIRDKYFGTETERERLRAATRRSLQARQQGLAAGNAPYGFRAMPDGTLEEDAQEQACLVLMQSLYQQGHSCAGIASALNAHGYTTRQGTPCKPTAGLQAAAALSRLRGRDGSAQGRHSRHRRRRSGSGQLLCRLGMVPGPGMDAVGRLPWARARHAAVGGRHGHRGRRGHYRPYACAYGAE